ncbi:hypothetical protein GCM10023317_32040 [Actinopolymorpha pittospori]
MDVQDGEPKPDVGCTTDVGTRVVHRARRRSARRGRNFKCACSRPREQLMIRSKRSRIGDEALSIVDLHTLGVDKDGQACIEPSSTIIRALLANLGVPAF